MRHDKKEYDNDDEQSETEMHTSDESTHAEVQDAKDWYEHHDANEGNHDLHGSQNTRNLLTGHHGDDRLVGGSQHDILTGAEGNDELEGADGDDVLIGGGDHDVGHNHLSGGVGNDVLIAGGHKTKHLDHFLKAHPELAAAVTADTKYADLASLVQADVGSDFSSIRNTFVFHEKSGSDHIFNFHAETDQIQLDKGLNGSDIRDISSLISHVSVSGNDLCIDLGDGNQLTLIGVDLTKMSADNIVFA